MFYHLISFRLIGDDNDAQADAMLRELGELRAQIPQIKSYHYGRNDADNLHSKNLSHCFVMAFGSKTDRYTYQSHPLHLAFIRTRLEPVLADSVVFDFNDMGEIE